MYETEKAGRQGRSPTPGRAKPQPSSLQREQEKQTQESARWESVLESVPAVVFRAAPDGTVRSINAIGELITGWQRDEVIGRNWWQTFYPDDEYRQVQQLFRDLECGDVRNYEMVLTTRVGTRRTISWAYIQILNDAHTVEEIVGFGIDVTDQRRAEELMRAQRDLGILLSAETRLTEALAACLEAAMQASEMECGGIYLVNSRGRADLVVQEGLPQAFVDRQVHFDDDGLHHSLIHEGDLKDLNTHAVAESIRDLIASAHFRMVTILPVRHEGQIIACLITASDQRDTVSASARAAVDTIAMAIGTAIARIRAEESVREEQQFLKQVLDLQERERRLVAYEIHDGLAQQLSGGIMQLQAFQTLKDRYCEKADEDLKRMQQLLSDSLAEARNLIAGLRPMILDELGVVAAIQHLIHEIERRDLIEIELIFDEQLDRLVPTLETAVFRVVQEALNNACQHSKSESVSVELRVREGRIKVVVEDWGIGFDPKDVKETRFGLRGVRERARLLGGQVTIDSAPGLGTCVTVELPLVTEATESSARCLRCRAMNYQV